MKKELILIIIIFIVALIFRLWFITLVPQPFLYDQIEYERYAAKMLNSPLFLAAHSFRSYPWPLVMAFIYKFFGYQNHGALYFFNAILDSLTSVIIFLTLYTAYKKFRLALIGGLIYAFNPFSSGYVGTGLSEILTAFFITGTFFWGTMLIKSMKIRYALMLGLFAGMAAETRNAAFIWAAIPIVLVLLYINFLKNLKIYMVIFAGLAITTLYPLYTNWREYGEISITKVDSFYAMELFNGATLKILPPFTKDYPVEQNQMWWEYYSEYYPGRTTAERKAIADKYTNKAIAIIKKDPIDYIKWRFFKAWYVWQKENVFFYIDPGWEARRPLIFFGNTILLVLAVIGVFSKQKKTISVSGKWLRLSLLGTIFYCSFAFSFSHAEYRLTIPFYGVIALSSAPSIDLIYGHIKRALAQYRS